MSKRLRTTGIDGTIIDSATYSETLDRISTLTQELANTQGELENIILENNDLRTQNKNLTTQISALKSLCQSMTTPNKLGTIKNSAKRLVLPQNSDASFIPSTPTSTPKSDHIYALTNLHRKISELQEQLSEASKEITCLTKQIEGLQVKLTIQKKDSTTPTQKLQTISAHEIEKKEKPADFRKIIILGAQQCVGLASALLYSRQQTQYEKYAIISETKPNALSSEIVKNYRSLNLAANDKLVISLGENDFNQKSVPSQLYLVLDVTNLTSEEMDFHYAPSKHILIESKESCRVPVPLDRCPFNTTPSKTTDEDLVESKSTNTGTSTNSLELMCSEHITNNTALRWHLMQSDTQGKASVKGITLSQAMMDIVRMSPLNWEVSVNSQCIKPQEEYNCSAGECLSLGVAVWNHLSRPLHKLCLSVQFYQDYNNGVLSYKLDNRVATAGNNKVVLTTLPESAKAYHECTVVFLTPGEYKIDIQCSTTEPILDEVPLIKETDHPSIIQPCAGEVSHIWRFIPPVAISVTD